MKTYSASESEHIGKRLPSTDYGELLTTSASQGAISEGFAMQSSTAVSTRRPFAVFLQCGGAVKKVTIEAQLSFPSLRTLFSTKFSLNYAHERFPAMYIQDQNSGIKYELEDVGDVQENSFLSLDIDRQSYYYLLECQCLRSHPSALGEIKQHIDSQIALLSKDIKNLQSVLMNERRHITPSNVPGIFGRRTPVSRRDGVSQLRRRVSTFLGSVTITPNGPS